MSGEFSDEGVWLSQRAARQNPLGAGLLLDRDGVLVEEVDYLSKPEDVRLEAGAVELLSWAQRNQVAVAVATNQSGIARGLFDWNNYWAVEAELDRQLAAHGLFLDMVIACPFHDDYTAGFGPRHARWRKPGPAMLLLAVEQLRLDPARTWMIGDKDSDIEAAKAAELAGAILVLSGHGDLHREKSLLMGGGDFKVVVAQDLFEVPAILKDIVRRV